MINMLYELNWHFLCNNFFVEFYLIKLASYLLQILFEIKSKVQKEKLTRKYEKY